MSDGAGYPFTPDYVVPTSEVLDEWLRERSLSPYVAAAVYPRGQAREHAVATLQAVLDDAVVDEETAAVLHRVTDISVAFWLAFDGNYRAGLAAGRRVLRGVFDDLRGD